jgi:positive regulator of sigma E activity
LKEIGKVVEINNDIATVELSADQQTCKSCPTHNLCGLIPLMRKVRALNSKGARIGDLVEIDLKKQTSLKIVFLVYIVPLIMFFTGVLIASGLNKSQTIQLLTGSLFFVATFIALYLLNKKISKLPDNLSKMEKVIKKAP